MIVIIIISSISAFVRFVCDYDYDYDYDYHQRICQFLV